MGARKASSTPVPPFDVHAAETVGRLRRAFAAIVDALPEPVTRASELQHVLEIDKVLGWRVYSVIRSTDPFAAARHIPGAAGVKIFLRAAQAHGVPATLTDAAAAALVDYERLVRIHAGDRKRLDMMLAAHSDEGRAESDLATRRAAYQANSYIWGVSAEVQLAAVFVGFSETPGQVDLACVQGFVRLQRTRPNVRWPLSLVTCTRNTGAAQPGLSITPLYDVGNPDKVAAKLFMSQPPPRIECVPLAGALQWELLPGPVGKTGAVTCVTGEIARRIGGYRRSKTDTYAEYTTRVRTASELLISDQFVHRDLYGRIEPELLVYGHFNSPPRSESDRLPVQDVVRYMGTATDVLHTPEVPHYADMARFVFERLGWEPQDFDVYRVRMEYPIMSSEVKIRNPLRDE